jgi:hypothetical protein
MTNHTSLASISLHQLILALEVSILIKCQSVYSFRGEKRFPFALINLLKLIKVQEKLLKDFD